MAVMGLEALVGGGVGLEAVAVMGLEAVDDNGCCYY